MNVDELKSVARKWLAGFVIMAVVSMPLAQAAPSNPARAPLEIVLVEAGEVTPKAVSQWRGEGFKAVAIVLDDRQAERSYREAAQHLSQSQLDLYYWIEVARSPKLAAAHPRWMATLGMHEDWQKNFPNAPEPRFGEIAKAFPWVPIGYREAFDAHLARIEQLLKRAPAGWRGLLLNDLQAGPSSCGCGNLLCRWAIDYKVRSTATKIEGDDVAARFVAEVQKRVSDKEVVPVWTTECEMLDSPASKHPGQPGTGLCGTVPCATGACPGVFTRQWSALTSTHSGPIGLLALPAALGRRQPAAGGSPGWVTNAIAYLDQTLPANGDKAMPHERLWAVVQASGDSDEAAARELAARAGVSAVIVAHAKINQSYEPKMLPAE